MLRLPPLLDKHTNRDLGLGEEIAQHYRHINGDKAVSRNVDGSICYGNLVKSTEIEAFCRGREDEGAVYYAELENSPEVFESGLLNVEGALKNQPIADY